MHGNQAENKSLLSAIVAGVAESRGKGVAVCAPYPYLPLVQTMLRDTNIAWGAQNVSQYDKGAYTGEISAAMLKDFGCSYVIVGHSERRALYNEDSHTVALKYVAVQQEGMVPILCVGETLEQRESGITEKIISEQLDAVMNMAGVASLGKAVIAYEPVWAIGTGKTATPQQAQEIHEFIRARVAIQSTEKADSLVILYGGSVKANNAAELFSMPDIDGGLIGGASLVATEFISICQALQN